MAKNVPQHERLLWHLKNWRKPITTAYKRGTMVRVCRIVGHHHAMLPTFRHKYIFSSRECITMDSNYLVNFSQKKIIFKKGSRDVILYDFIMRSIQNILSATCQVACFTSRKKSIELLFLNSLLSGDASRLGIQRKLWKWSDILVPFNVGYKNNNK